MSTAPTKPVVPIFQYNFEDVNGKLTDLSGNGFDIPLPPSGVASVNDPVMGSCLQFQGTTEGHIMLPKLPYTGVSDFSNGLTISMWVNADSFAANTTPILLNFGGAQEIPGTSTSVANDVGLRLNGMTPYFNRDYADLEAKKQGSATLNSTESITAGDWVHLAVTVDHLGCATFYKGGVAQAPKTNSDFKPSAPTTPIQGNIGASAGSEVPPFKGMMAWLAVYNGVLQDIPREMALGQSNRYFVSNRSFPMDFKLFSSDAGADSPIMFIESTGVDQMLDFHIVNTSKKPISIPVGSGTADATSNYHFQLKFRPGILSENYVTKHKGTNPAKPLLDGNSWSTHLHHDLNNDVMSFLYKGSAAMVLDAGKEFVLYLKKINASATGGSKNTNIEFKYQGIGYGSSDHKIEGHRTQNISIVNHTGDKNIPLRAEIAGMASVMTYHKATGVTAPTSELMFHLLNTDATNALELGTSSSINGTTTFTLSVDVQPENQFMDWALFAQGEGDPKVVMDVIGVVRSFDGTTITLRAPLAEALDANTPLQIAGVTDPVTVGTSGAKAGTYTIVLSTTTTQTITDGAVITPTTGLGAWTAKKVTTDAPPNQMQWNITNNSAQSFDAGKGLSFLLTGLECSLPAGTSTITIGYANIPNHWDGSFALPVQKSPVAYNENLMGINTQEPMANLHIVEEEGNVPLRIERMVGGTLPEPIWSDNEAVWGSNLSVIDAKKQLYYSNMGGGSIKILDFQNKTHQQVNPQVPNKPNILGSTFIYHVGYFYNLGGYGGDSGCVSTFGYAPPSDLTYINLVDSLVQKTSGINQILYKGYIFAALGSNSTSFIMLKGLAVPGEPPSLGFETVANVNLGTAVNHDIFIICGEYLGVSMQEAFYLFDVASDGSWTQKAKIDTSSFQNYWSQYSEGQICLFDNNQNGVIIDISGESLDSVSPVKFKLAKQIGLNYGRNWSFHKGNLLVFIDSHPSIGIYEFDSTGRLSRYKTVVWEAGKYLWNFQKMDDFVSLSTTTISGDTTQNMTYYLYKSEAFFNHVLAQCTLIGSEGITIGANELNDTASISLPYPLPEGYNGIAIGDTSTWDAAALSISVSNSSVIDPVAIRDAAGNPVFNIKKPSETGYPYTIGIGTDNPQAALHVVGGPNYTTPVPYTQISSTSGSLNHQEGHPIGPYTSILASAIIMGSGFVAISDVRTKELLGSTSGIDDLSNLLKLKVRDYEYIDFIQQGTAPKKGLIAQEVQEVFPQAVSAENTDFIPDIYAMATDVGWHPETQHLNVSLEKTHDLKVGDKVRLIADKGFEEKEVVTIPDHKSFVVADWEKPVEKLFVFGKEVHDFHTVDYDQVAMLGVSAIQTLHAEVEDLKKENESLKTQMQSEMATLKAEWAAFKSSITKQYQN
ncbi:LamG-like jellyroll fold domain-containing protein [Roseivirga pacifica]|uniref:LamG-like jellyroll fold domain-containing protein n=1 Tax=Roseivirga pacifica TaxID=1267423 RepID=UPI002095EBD5|nr:LamG-like jellyroll fold domain-containing protein [Roseivirga pacifica]MCO6358757.1 hypothetical protein [Roseivirga pacifica]MCO6365607.1 hypothetical protein [Roseivirga pacifica]MCO6371663.1 hypothetical protein [Roseivirga pacifica]MCO6376226.1 hypothetical protein [Roseivirga pacifica]MCO6379041.1 hypothetical protein [Roseivirga pacifica]